MDYGWRACVGRGRFRVPVFPSKTAGRAGGAVHSLAARNRPFHLWSRGGAGGISGALARRPPSGVRRTAGGPFPQSVVTVA